MANRYETKTETGLDNLKVQVIVELGRAIKTLKEVQQVKEGTIMELDAYAGQAVDIFINNTLYGRGEVVVINDRFGIIFSEILRSEQEQIDSIADKEKQAE